MKRILCAVLCVALSVLCLCGCRRQSPDSTDSPTTSTTVPAATSGPIQENADSGFTDDEPDAPTRQTVVRPDGTRRTDPTSSGAVKPGGNGKSSANTAKTTTTAGKATTTTTGSSAATTATAATTTKTGTTTRAAGWSPWV